jgi:enterochelin esterase family protein
MEAFRSELLDDAIPLVDQHYHVSKDHDKRALAGLSMGGMHTLTVGLTGALPFGYLGAFSAAPPSDTYMPEILKNADKANATIKLLWIPIGKDDFLFRRNEEMMAKFKEAHINFEFSPTEGDHSWPVWRNYLAEFLQKIFL